MLRVSMAPRLMLRVSMAPRFRVRMAPRYGTSVWHAGMALPHGTPASDRSRWPDHDVWDVPRLQFERLSDFCTCFNGCLLDRILSSLAGNFWAS